VAIAAAVYLEGTNRPRVVAASVISANLLNIFLNWLFIPSLGARGSALSTTLVRCGLCVVLAGIAWRTELASPPVADHAFVHTAAREGSRRAQWRLGLGAAGTVAAMVALGAWLTIFAGWLGVLPLAVFSASWNLAAPAALVALGMADATGILVSAETGRGGSGAPVAWACAGTTLPSVAPLAAILAIQPRFFAALYTNDSAMRESMTLVLPLVALIVAVDAAGFAIGASLRALREAAWPAAMEIGSMALLVPAAAALAFGRGLGVRGLFIAMLMAAAVRTAMLTGRFRWCIRATKTELACRTI
jgi:MATE family multidrug resistance protein